MCIGRMKKKVGRRVGRTFPKKKKSYRLRKGRKKNALYKDEGYIKGKIIMSGLIG